MTVSDIETRVADLRLALEACAAQGILPERVSFISQPAELQIQPYDECTEATARAVLLALTEEDVMRADFTGATTFSTYTAGRFEMFADLHPDATLEG